MSDKAGGPAFPNGPGGDSWHHEDGRISHQWPAHPGMDLLDWFAGQETLAEFDHPDASYGDKLAFSFAGPKPTGGWPEDPRGMFEWEAKVRAGMKYTRASAMLAEKARREATGKDCSQVLDHSPDAGKMARLEGENRELVEAIETIGQMIGCALGRLRFTVESDAKILPAISTILAKHQTPKKEVGRE